MADGLGADVHESPSPTASDPAGATSIFTAIQKQLGLRLDKTSGVPLDVIIVDSVGKTPTEN
jgi:uncharacterized protein (TIGR03435 family)